MIRGISVLAVTLLFMTTVNVVVADTAPQNSNNINSSGINREVQSDPTEEVFPLPEIAVTAKRIEAPATIVVRTVSIQDIEAWNAPTAGEALTYVAGVNIQIGGSSADSRAWIRGFRDRDVLVLFDGIPIASGFEGTIDLNEISLQNISRIKVMKSAPSVVYGTNGMGGVIDVIPQSGVEGTSISGRLELGSDERGLLRAAASGGNGNISFGISASHQRADDFSLSGDYMPQLNQESGSRVNSDFERTSLFMQLEALNFPLGRASVFINHSDAEKGLPVEAGVDDPDYERLTGSNRTTVGLSNHFNRIPLSLKLYYNSYDSELTAYTDERFEEIDEVERADDYSWGGKLYSRVETSANNSLVLTASGQADVFRGEGELEDGNRAELATYTLAVEDQFWITERLSLAAGLIYTYFDQTLLGRTSSAINPQVALAWQSNDKFTVHASAAQRTRFPKLRELYRRRYGNPDLEEQTANNYEIGIRYRHPTGFIGDISVFRSDIDNLIEREHRRALYTNFDRVTLQGIEMSAETWWADRFFTRLAYTWVDAEEALEDGSKRQLRSRPEHTAIIDMRYEFRADLLLSFNGIFVEGLHDLDPDGNYTRLDSYFVSNIKLIRSFASNYEIYAAVSNVLDENYQQRIGNPREGRAFLLGLDVKF
jgi:outer membrane cobalamin receptor